MLTAFLAESGKERLQKLRKEGWSAENQVLADCYRKVISRKKYSGYRQGQDEKKKDHEKMRYLEEMTKTNRV